MSDQVSRESVDNARTIVELLGVMQERSERVLSNMDQAFSSTDRMVSVQRSLADQHERSRDAMSDAQRSQSEMNRLLQESLETNSLQDDYYQSMINSINGINEGLEESTFLYTKRNKLQEKTASLSQKINEIGRAFTWDTSDFNTASSKVRDLFNAYSRFNEEYSDAPMFRKLAVGVEAFGEMTNSVLDAITAHPIVRIVTVVLKGLMSIYDAAKKVIQIIGFITQGAIAATKKLGELMIGIPLKISEFAAKIGGTLRKETRETFDQMVEDIKERVNINSKLGQSFQNSVEEAKTRLHEFYDINNELVKQFGFGSQGVQNLLNQSTELIHQLGVNLNFFGETIGRDPVSRMNFVKIAKALNLSAQDVENLGIIARSTGQGIFSLGRTMYDTIGAAAKKFSLDSKSIQGTVFNLRGDFLDFGHMTTEAIAETVAELTQLGVQAEDISGMLKKFDTFETAAQSAALLSQTFGMNVDALKLIQAESPAEIFHELTSAMYNTGRSFQDLNRHERALLAQHTGLSGKTLQMVMNFTEMGMSYEEAINKAEEQDPIRKQTRALDDMTGSIKQLIKVLTFKSPFEAFAKGLKNTIINSSGLRSEVEALSAKYEQFYTLGLKLDNDVIRKAAEPFKGLIKEISDILGGQGMKDLMTDLTINIGKFTSAIMADTFDKDVAINAIKDMFGVKNISTSGSLINELLKTGGKIIGYIVKGVFSAGIGIAESIITLIGELPDQILKGEISYTDLFDEIASKYFGFNDVSFMELWNKFFDSIGGVLTKIKPLMAPVSSIIIGVFEEIASKIADLLANAITRAVSDIPVLNWFTDDDKLVELGKSQKLSQKQLDFFTDPKKMDELIKSSTVMGEGGMRVDSGLFSKVLAEEKGITSGDYDQGRLKFVGQMYGDLERKEKELNKRITNLEGKGQDATALKSVLKSVESSLKTFDDKRKSGEIDDLGEFKLLFKQSVTEFAKVQQEYKNVMKPTRANDFWIQMHDNDEIFGAKPGGLLDKMFNFFGMSGEDVGSPLSKGMTPYDAEASEVIATVLSPFEAVGNTMKSFVSGLIGGETNKELIKEIKDLKKSIESRPIIVQGDINMDGKKVADVSWKHFTDPNNMSYRLKPESYIGSSMQSTDQYG